MNVLIVDDEPIIRIGMKSLVDWEENGFRLVGEAADGEEALEALGRLPVDIVITDIRMPKMDGLALLRAIRSGQADVGILVLSCLDDFAFVKEAMKLGAYDYLLKPTMEPEELLDILQAVRGRLEEDRQTKRALSEWRERQRQSGPYRLAEALRDYERTGAAERERLEAELLPPGSGLFSLWIEGRLEALPALDEWDIPDCRAAIRWGDGVWIVLCSYTRSLSEKERYDRVYACAQTLHSRLKEAIGSAADWFIGMGPGIGRLEEFSAAVAAHERQRHARFYADPERLLAPVPFQQEKGELPGAERHDFLRAVSNGNVESALDSLERMEQALRDREPDVARLRSFLLDMLTMASELAGQPAEAAALQEERLADMLEPIRSIGHIDPLCGYVKEATVRLLDRLGYGGSARESSNPFIRKALRFMYEHYSRNIGAVDIADHVKLSRSYLSDLFSKETGESLIESLTRIRIEEAKRQLRSGERKVYEIAEAVGFSDPKSFAKTFKRLVGCAPKEYEQRNRD